MLFRLAGARCQPVQWQAIQPKVQGHHEEAQGSARVSADGWVESTQRSISYILTDCIAGRPRTDEFFQIFNKNQMTVMVGETGSGKTTQ